MSKHSEKRKREQKWVRKVKPMTKFIQDKQCGPTCTLDDAVIIIQRFATLIESHPSALARMSSGFRNQVEMTLRQALLIKQVDERGVLHNIFSKLSNDESTFHWLLSVVSFFRLSA
jgi:hypothetical protein